MFPGWGPLQCDKVHLKKPTQVHLKNPSNRAENVKRNFKMHFANVILTEMASYGALSTCANI